MEITKGKVKSALKIVLYAPEGFGKSTFMSQLPDPVFIDTEGSTKQLDVARFGDMMQDWNEILAAVHYVIDHPDCCKTLVIDTADWAEQACIAYTVSQGGQNIKSIEDYGYGKGYVYVQENFQKLLSLLDKVIALNINVAFTAHAQMRKFEQPDEMGAYDRWELKLSKKDSPILKEWADIVLFGNYKTLVYEDSKTKTKKAQGGERIMYTTHHACWDAKNRHGLPDQLPFKYEAIAHLFSNVDKPAKTEKKEEKKKEEKPAKKATPEIKIEIEDDGVADMNIPDDLKKLMLDNGVAGWEVRTVVSNKGVYPYDTTIEEYDPGFVQNALINQWDKMFKLIIQNRSDVPDAVPFD